jgi:hypothetical protein
MSRRFQFSMRLLLVWIAVIATAAWGATSKSNLVAAISLNVVALLFCSLTIIAAIVTTGKSSAFWIGAAIPAAAGAALAVLDYYTCLGTFSNPPDWKLGAEYLASQLRTGLPPIWCLAILNAILCVLIHWLAWPQPAKRCS